ncbi:MAG TPA: anthrone oxygenase family protein [Rhizobiaceae bacterium]|nr:anthrone oxygenase family protein [Rhizobiaceae bacterium]
MLIPIAIFAAALGSGLMAGLFFAYSTSVMPALAQMPNGQGATAMNIINVVIQNPLFLSVFMGTALLSLLLVVAVFTGMTVKPTWVILGAALYLIGNIGISFAINIPLNNELAAINPGSSNGAQMWATYLNRWVFWNHVRAAACLASLAAFIVALM